jgi:hypothetical protein
MTGKFETANESQQKSQDKIPRVEPGNSRIQLRCIRDVPTGYSSEIFKRRS